MRRRIQNCRSITRYPEAIATDKNDYSIINIHQ